MTPFADRIREHKEQNPAQVSSTSQQVWTEDIIVVGQKKTLSLLFYTVNHKKGGSTFVIITLENLDEF